MPPMHDPTRDDRFPAFPPAGPCPTTPPHRRKTVLNSEEVPPFKVQGMFLVRQRGRCPRASDGLMGSDSTLDSPIPQGSRSVTHPLPGPRSLPIFMVFGGQGNLPLVPDFSIL